MRHRSSPKRSIPAALARTLVSAFAGVTMRLVSRKSLPVVGIALVVRMATSQAMASSAASSSTAHAQSCTASDYIAAGAWLPATGAGDRCTSEPANREPLQHAPIDNTSRSWGYFPWPNTAARRQINMSMAPAESYALHYAYTCTEGIVFKHPPHPPVRWAPRNARCLERPPPTLSALIHGGRTLWLVGDSLSLHLAAQAAFRIADERACALADAEHAVEHDGHRRAELNDDVAARRGNATAGAVWRWSIPVWRWEGTKEDERQAKRVTQCASLVPAAGGVVGGTAARETAARETAARETAARETGAARETAARETAAHDTPRVHEPQHQQGRLHEHGHEHGRWQAALEQQPSRVGRVCYVPAGTGEGSDSAASSLARLVALGQLDITSDLVLVNEVHTSKE